MTGSGGVPGGKPGTMRRNRVLLALTVALAALATGLGLVATRGGSSRAATTPRTPLPVVSGAQALTLQFERVVQAVEPSVVQIETTQGLGSGVILDAQGHIVTNAHVIGSARTFAVTLYNGSRVRAALVGSFPPEDIGVIKIEAKNLRPVTWAQSAKVGEIVMAIGNPLGLRASVTQGIVSAVGLLGEEGGGIVLPDTVQTSAAINPGNSGGALVNLRGEMVGIPTLGAINPEAGTPASGIGLRSRATARSSSRGSSSQTDTSRTPAARSSASAWVRLRVLPVSSSRKSSRAAPPRKRAEGGRGDRVARRAANARPAGARVGAGAKEAGRYGVRDACEP